MPGGDSEGTEHTGAQGRCVGGRGAGGRGQTDRHIRKDRQRGRGVAPCSFLAVGTTGNTVHLRL